MFILTYRFGGIYHVQISVTVKCGIFGSTWKLLFLQIKRLRSRNNYFIVITRCNLVSGEI